MRKKRNYRALLKPLKVVTLGAIVFGVSACASLPTKPVDMIDPNAPKNLDNAVNAQLEGWDVLIVDSTQIKKEINDLRWETNLGEGALRDEDVPKDLAVKAQEIVRRSASKQKNASQKTEHIKVLGNQNFFDESFDYMVGVSSDKKKAVIFLQEKVSELYSEHSICGLDEALGPSFFEEYTRMVKAHEARHAWQYVMDNKAYNENIKKGHHGELVMENDADLWMIFKASQSGISKTSLKVWTDIRAWELMTGKFAPNHATSPKLYELLAKIIPEESARGEDPIIKMKPEKLIAVFNRFNKIVEVETMERYWNSELFNPREMYAWEDDIKEACFTKAFIEQLERMETIAYCLEKGRFGEEEAVWGRHMLKSGVALLDIVKDYAASLPDDQEICFQGFDKNAIVPKGKAGAVVRAMKAFKNGLEKCEETKEFKMQAQRNPSVSVVVNSLLQKFQF